MARSYRKPYGTVCKKVRKDKIITNRMFRRITKRLILQGKEVPLKKNEVRNIYDYTQDGKVFHWPHITYLKRK